MNEAKVAFIPRVVGSTRVTDRFYGLVLTDTRALLVFEWAFNRVLSFAGMFGGLACGVVLAIALNTRGNTPIYLVLGFMILGPLVARVFMPRNHVDYDAMTPEGLAGLQGTIDIPYASLVKLSVERPDRRVFSRLRLERVDASGGRTTLAFALRPEPAWFRARRREGLSPTAAHEAYAADVRKAFSTALPPEVASRVLVSP